MEQERFDRITRALTTRHSRRGVLKGMTGAALGGALAAVGLADASAKGPLQGAQHQIWQGQECRLLYP